MYVLLKFILDLLVVVIIVYLFFLSCMKPWTFEGLSWKWDSSKTFLKAEETWWMKYLMKEQRTRLSLELEWLQLSNHSWTRGIQSRARIGTIRSPASNVCCGSNGAPSSFCIPIVTLNALFMACCLKYCNQIQFAYIGWSNASQKINNLPKYIVSPIYFRSMH